MRLVTAICWSPNFFAGYCQALPGWRAFPGSEIVDIEDDPKQALRLWWKCKKHMVDIRLYRGRGYRKKILHFMVSKDQFWEEYLEMHTIPVKP